MSATTDLPSILVMDRDRGQQPAVQAFRAYGRLAVADDSDDALALATRETPDLIIVDAVVEGTPVDQRVAGCGWTRCCRRCQSS